ncbi:MAG: hypothetical protein BZY79_02390 [SAR202 cluster bacterium Casp-Chloro-G4]|nr:FAD-dependent oxidoreductase [Chloroflexota bacterium]MDA1228016.1 FAD-dependent oxidoreductase [Chloroflexota bacterium]PKB61680.1 MAG: hypothetical protein BZY79_02390 [SAR202 cluster bacterium Casp-Chloro-G4]
MNAGSSEVVIVGGGVVGIATAYFLGLAGVRSTVIERDSVGSHASGFAYGGLTPLSGAGIPGPVYPLAKEGLRLHSEFAKSLPEETGVATEFRLRPSLSLSFTEDEVDEAKGPLAWQQEQDGYRVEWVDAAKAMEIEPRVSEEILGGVYVEGVAEVEPYKFILALTQAAEKMGATVRHGNVNGLRTSGGKVTGVVTETGEIPCGAVVIAIGPWSADASSWTGLDIPIRPLKGQILRLKAPGAPFDCSIGWAGNYANTKMDGLLWTGTTEEEAGFDENPTAAARDQIMASLLKMIPSLLDAELVQHTACLRPLSVDGIPILGPVPGLEGAYIATGAGRKGILLGPGMAKALTDQILKGAADFPIEPFSPARFG